MRSRPRCARTSCAVWLPRAGLDPSHGCTNVTWSFKAVVKTALRMALLALIVPDEMPSSRKRATQARTCSGRISTTRIGPNSGRMCFRSEYVWRRHVRGRPPCLRPAVSGPVVTPCRRPSCWGTCPTTGPVPSGPCSGVAHPATAPDSPAGETHVVHLRG